MIKLSLLYHGMQTPMPMQLMQCVWTREINMFITSLLSACCSEFFNSCRKIRSKAYRSYSPTVENASLDSKDVSNVKQPASKSTEGGLPSPVTIRQDQTACLLSGWDSDNKPFQHELAASSWNDGGLGFMVTSPPGRLATSKLATNSHPFLLCIFFACANYKLKSKIVSSKWHRLFTKAKIASPKSI